MSMKDLQAYEVQKEEDLRGIKAKGYLLRHRKSGARVVFNITRSSTPSGEENAPFISLYTTPLYFSLSSAESSCRYELR